METVNVEELFFPQHCNERTLMVRDSIFMIFVMRNFVLVSTERAVTDSLPYGDS